MKQEITGVYDLTENCFDVWEALYPNSDNEPHAADLANIRAVIVEHYAATARRLGELRNVQFKDCATWRIQMRAGKEVTNFETGERYQIPPYFEVEVNASPTMEGLISAELTPPVPNVK